MSNDKIELEEIKNSVNTNTKRYGITLSILVSLILLGLILISYSYKRNVINKTNMLSNDIKYSNIINESLESLYEIYYSASPGNSDLNPQNQYIQYLNVDYPLLSIKPEPDNQIIYYNQRISLSQKYLIKNNYYIFIDENKIKEYPNGYYDANTERGFWNYFSELLNIISKINNNIITIVKYYGPPTNPPINNFNSYIVSSEIGNNILLRPDIFNSLEFLNDSTSKTEGIWTIIVEKNYVSYYTNSFIKITGLNDPELTELQVALNEYKIVATDNDNKELVYEYKSILINLLIKNYIIYLNKLI